MTQPVWKSRRRNRKQKMAQKTRRKSRRRKIKTPVRISTFLSSYITVVVVVVVVVIVLVFFVLVLVIRLSVGRSKNGQYRVSRNSMRIRLFSRILNEHFFLRFLVLLEIECGFRRNNDLIIVFFYLKRKKIMKPFHLKSVNKSLCQIELSQCRNLKQEPRGS